MRKIWCFYSLWFCSVGDIFSEELKCRHIEHSFWNELGNGSLSKLSNRKCADNKICKKHYRIQYISFPPYSYYPTLEPRLIACCGKCINYTVHKEKLLNLSAITETTINTSDFILPVLGDHGKSTMYGLHFIPMCTVPDYLYITHKTPSVFSRMLTKGKSAVPLIIVCLLMCLIAGFITWAFETYFNEEEFPRPFFRGWWEGIWWSFISITTVGYGDKTPKTFPGRLFAMIWILTGITLFGILTGLLTTGIMSANQREKPTMKMKDVGVLNFRIQDALFVATHDGNVVQTPAIDFYDNIIELATELKDNRIKGIALDKLTYVHVVKEMYADLIKTAYSDVLEPYREHWKSAMEFLVNKTMITEKKYDEKQLSYGILVKSKEVHDYFHDAVADNRLIFETWLTMYISKLLKGENAPNIFSVENENFEYAVAAMGAATGIIIIFGIIFSKKHIKRERHIQPVHNFGQARMVTEFVGK